MKKHCLLFIFQDKARSAELCDFLSTSYDIESVGSSAEAFDFLRLNADKVCAILTDSPAGFEFTKDYREDSSYPHLPILVIQQQNSHGEEAILALGASDFISLPIIKAVVKRRIDNAVALYEASERIASIELDPLTDIFHKDAFFTRVEERLNTEPDAKYAIFATDIEHFKLINDSYGNDEGDKILIALAQNIREISHKCGGVCARFSADQFVALVPFDDEKKFEKYIRGIIPTLENSAGGIKISIKVGIYPIHNIDISIATMCDRALLAAASIKGSYGKHFAFYNDEIRRRLLFEQRLTSEMKAALEHGEFEVYLQPKYDLVSERIAGAEALVRWNHPELGLIPPNEFIPLFERSGFISELDAYVWETTCKTMKKWITLGHKYVPVSVNVSRRDIYHESLPGAILNIVKSYGLTPDQLHLEITETAYTETPEQLITAVTTLKELGFFIEMDDFGSGYSSLNMLSELPIDMLKLDMRFIQKQNHSNASRNILSFIISLAKWMNLLVVAEGVETQEQIDLLRTMDCNYVQGYYYSKPIPEPQFTDILLNSELAVPIDISEQQVDTPAGKKGTMLIVDDVAINREMLAAFFGELFNIVQKENGADAYDYIQENFDKIDIIMLDLIMPVMDGFELLTLLKQNRLYSDIPVIVTSQAGGESEVRALSLGASDYIAKPYSMEIALHRVQNVTTRNTVRIMEREKRMLDKMRVLAAEARMDAMTGLCNRAELENQIEAYIKKPDCARAVFIIIDIDEFKRVNDELGHTQGDAAIRRLADILRGHFRDDDVICRMGGDEFAVFMKADLTPQQLSMRLAALSSKLNYFIGDMPLTCSIGACTFPDLGENYNELYQHADIALLAAKRLGKNQYQIYGGLGDMPAYAFVRSADWLLDEMTDGVYVCDANDYKVLFVNKAVCENIGISKKECIGQPCYKAFLGFDKPCSFCTPLDKLSNKFTCENILCKYGNITAKVKLVNWGGKSARVYYLQRSEE